MDYTILVADDEKEIRELLRLYLENSGYKVVEAEDGQQALDILRSKPVDLCLLDIMMPKKDGYHVLQELRKESNIPVVILSAKDADSYAAKIVNNRLGASSSAMLFDILRLKRGYTYGAYSSFSTALYNNSFSARSSVQATATKPSVELFREIVGGYGDVYTQEMLESTVESMKKASYASLENSYDQMSMVMDTFIYGLEDDYMKKEEQELSEMTLDRAKEIIEKYLDIDKMVIVVVGDAKTQYEPLKQTGLEIGLYDSSLNPIK